MRQVIPAVIARSDATSTAVILRESGVSSTPRLLVQSLRLWNTGSPAFAGDDVGRHALAFSRHDLPELCQIRCPSLETEGAGNAGCALHPRSHVPKCARMAAHEHTGERRTLRHPLRNGFTAYFVLSPVERACCHRHLRDYFPPTCRQHRGARTTRLRRTPLSSRLLNKSVHHIPCPTFRDDREAPLVWAGMARVVTSDLPN